MKLHGMIKGALSTLGLVSCISFASSASAIVVEGTFSLIAGGNGGSFNGQTIAVGTEVATGSYSTQDFDPTNSDGTFNYSQVSANGSLYSFTAVQLASFELNDIFGNTFIGGSDSSTSDFVSPEPFAILDAQGGVGSAVDFLIGDTGPLVSGNIFNGSVTQLSLGFDQDGVTGEYSITGASASTSWSTGLTFSFFGSNGNQEIPEPSSIALLGAGFVAFGVFRRRRMS